ncbi:MAG: hypothetical protein Q8R88_16130 [Desulfoprunum sp.]|nr:hypothetical protein [Desulfoprunum sp.]
MAHTCKNCGATADDPGHLCNPTQEIVSCSYCNMPDVSINHICKEKLAAMKYSCQTCGRVAPDAGGLCKPGKIA